MFEPLLQAHHRVQGATMPADGRGEVLIFSNVPLEYRSGEEGAALVDQTGRGLVVVRGDDRASFLHRLTANEVRGLAVGQGSRNLLLNSKGKVLFDFDLAVEEDALRLSTSAGSAAGLVKALDMYHFSEKVEFEDATEQSAPLALSGPESLATASRVLGSFEAPPPYGSSSSSFQSAQVRLTRLPVAGGEGLRLDVGPQSALALWEALTAAGATACGRIAQDALRAEAGWAEPGIDIDENVYPQEARLERGFSLDKGCYIGQEVVAKIDTYGGLNKRLVALRVSNDEPIARGTRLLRLDEGEWRDLGVVTTWAYSFALDSGLVLAFVKRRHQAVGTEFRVGEGPQSASVVKLPLRKFAVPPTGEFE